MADIPCNQFQETVRKNLYRHKSIIDTLSRLQESSSQVNRATAKAVTSCGCLKIEAGRQSFPEGATLEDVAREARTHLEGAACANCREVIETKLGTMLFYMTALCELLGLDLGEVINRENDRISTLGLYSLT